MTTAQLYEQVTNGAQREALILRHVPLVRHVLGRLQARLPRGSDLENLEAAGVLGLVEAANRYDPRRGVQFETFAYTRVRGAILDEMRRNSPLPQELLERVARVRRAHAALAPPVTAEQLAQASGLTADEVAECLAAMRLTRVAAWDELSGARHPRRADDDHSPGDRLEREELHGALRRALTLLDRRERIVVTLYYLEDLRLKEIGEVLQLSESRVSKLLKVALFHLEELVRTLLPSDAPARSRRPTE